MMVDTLHQNRENHARQIERIRADRDLSAEAKRRKMAAVHEEAISEHQRLVEEEREQSARALEQMERKLLGISYPEGAKPHEKAIIAMSYRDARDRAERALTNRENPDALADLLDRAEKSGDDQLAEAVFHVATVGGLRVVADAYLEARPDVRRRWESYVAARQEAEPLNRMEHAIPPSRPLELGG